MQNWLLVHYNLSQRGMSSNPFCIRCGLAPELVCHCLWNCPSMKPVWKRCSYYDSTKVQDVWDPLKHLVLITKKISFLDFEHFLVLSWQIWNAKNSKLHVSIHLPSPFLA